ncbi:MAG: hypothetical protein ACM33T_17850 [Solirubrobacterales bacterium]
MLAEWIRNIPLALVNRIANDNKVRGSRVWVLACEELQRRRASMADAA